MTVLFDTNILLDVLQKRPLHYDYSSRAWNLVEQKVIVGYVAMISFNNTFYVLRKQIGSSRAREAIQTIRAIFQCVPFDEQMLDYAIAAPADDLEDAIQAASASQIKADFIVTRNSKDFAFSETPPISAEELLAAVKPG